MGFFSRDKGSKGPAKFDTSHDDKRKQVKDRVDKGAKRLEEERGTHGRGTGGKKD